MGRSRRWWVGWEAEGGLWLTLENRYVRSSVVSSVRARNRRNPQVRQRWSLAVVWHHSIFINAIKRLHRLVLHLCGFIGLAKSLL